jgi:hypothetical protein
VLSFVETGKTSIIPLVITRNPGSPPRSTAASYSITLAPSPAYNSIILSCKRVPQGYIMLCELSIEEYVEVHKGGGRDSWREGVRGRRGGEVVDCYLGRGSLGDMVLVLGVVWGECNPSSIRSSCMSAAIHTMSHT